MFDVVRAWKDEEYRLSLGEAERLGLPANPVGEIELSDADLIFQRLTALPSVKLQTILKRFLIEYSFKSQRTVTLNQKGEEHTMQEMVSELDDHTPQRWQRASWWYRAAPLTERIALKQKTTGSSNTSQSSDRAKQRLQRWKELSPFDKGDYFARRLAMDSLTEDDLLTLLDEPVEALPAHNAPPPPWLIELLTALTGEDTAADFTLPLVPTCGGTNPMASLNT